MLKMYQKGRIPNPHSQIKSYQVNSWSFGMTIECSPYCHVTSIPPIGVHTDSDDAAV